MDTVRVLLVATAIGATAGAAVIVALGEQSASNGQTSIATHALLTNAPVISPAAASQKQQKLIQVPPAPTTPSASAGPSAPVSTGPATSAANRTTTETTAARPSGGAGPAIEMKAEKSQKKHLVRRFRHRRIYDEYDERRYCCGSRRTRFGSMYDGW